MSTEDKQVDIPPPPLPKEEEREEKDKKVETGEGEPAAAKESSCDDSSSTSDSDDDEEEDEDDVEVGIPPKESNNNNNNSNSNDNDEKKKSKKRLLHRSSRREKRLSKEEKDKDKDKKHKKFPALFNMFSSLLTNIFSDKKAKAVESKRLKDWRESTAEIFARPTGSLPIHKDLPRLAKKVIFVDRRASAAPQDLLPEDPQSPLRNTADAPVSIFDAVGDFLWKAAFILCSSPAAAEIRAKYDGVIQESVAMDVQSEVLKDFITGLGEAHPVARLL